MAEFEEVSRRVGPDNAMDFNDVRRISKTRARLSIWSLLKEPLHELPQVRPSTASNKPRGSANNRTDCVHPARRAVPRIDAGVARFAEPAAAEHVAVLVHGMALLRPDELYHGAARHGAKAVRGCKHPEPD